MLGTGMGDLGSRRGLHLPRKLRLAERSTGRRSLDVEEHVHRPPRALRAVAWVGEQVGLLNRVLIDEVKQVRAPTCERPVVH
jgi:hypothetical protein